MEHCDHCAGCEKCSGCDRSLLLSQQELDLLREFAQLPFLPVARKPSSTDPVCLEFGDPAVLSPVIICLEKKGLIDIDYHMPLKSFDYSPYNAYALQGSMALTLRGQQVLDTLELQGFSEE